jgi:hypothetical protein
MNGVANIKRQNPGGLSMSEADQCREALFQALNQAIGGDAQAIEKAINDLIEAKIKEATR